MSSTNRGKGVYIRHEDDFFETPAWAVRCIGPYLPQIGRPGVVILDPFAGRGAILDVFRSTPGKYLPTAPLTSGIEIDEPRAELARAKGHTILTGDAFAPEPWPKFDVLITNPPFFAAAEAIERALTEAASTPEHKTIAFLLRLNFLGSAKRHPLHVQHPADLKILTKRPEFILSAKCGGALPIPHVKCEWKLQQTLDLPRPSKCGGCGGRVSITTSDSVEYAWFLWGYGTTPHHWTLLPLASQGD